MADQLNSMGLPRVVLPILISTDAAGNRDERKEDQVKKNSCIERSTRLFAAQREGSEASRVAQYSIAEEIMGPESLSWEDGCKERRHSDCRDMTAFEATVEFAKVIQLNSGATDRRFDLRVCEESMFRAIWKARQMVDMTGINYRDYVQRAVTYLRHCGKKRITPAMLVSAEVQLHVMELDAVSR